MRLFFWELYIGSTLLSDWWLCGWVGLWDVLGPKLSVSSAQKSFKLLPSVQPRCQGVLRDPVSHADVIPVCPTADTEDLPVAVHYAGWPSASCSPNLSCQMLFIFVLFTKLYAPAVP